MPVPPAPKAFAVPLELPLQLGFVPETVALTGVGFERVVFPEIVHDLESVTVTVKIPALSIEIEEVV